MAYKLAAYKKLQARLKQIRAKTLEILRKSSEDSDKQKLAAMQKKIDQK